MKYLLFLLLCIGILLPSCQSEELIGTGKEEPGTTTSEEDGYLSINLKLDTKTITRSVTEHVGIPEESYINGVNVVLYNERSNNAIASIYYDLIYNGNEYHLDGIDYEGSRINTEGFSVNKEEGRIILPPVRIKKQNYRMLIFVNPRSLYNNQLGPESDFSEITNPISFLEIYEYDHAISYGIGSFLSNLNPYRESYPGKYIFDQSTSFLMTNADGPVYINGDYEIKPFPEEALMFPVYVRVERALAKVTVYDELPTELKENGTVNDLKWACDIINMQTYLVRRPADIAPNTPGYPHEDIGVDRRFTYAEDPNYDHISQQRPYEYWNGEEINIDQHFFRISEDDNFFHDTYNAEEGNYNDEANKDKFEYVTENTMKAEEQYEDVTTRVVIKCQYKPDYIVLAGIASRSTTDENSSYFIYKGRAFTPQQLQEMYNDPRTIPTSWYPEMRYFREEVLVHDEFVSRCLSEPDEPFSEYGVDYYPNGINYYSIPIRHFENEDSPELMGHGRYGVVRNNIYRIKITGIDGPGSNKIPAPFGPDDKEQGNMKATVIVESWRQYSINFNL